LSVIVDVNYTSDRTVGQAAYPFLKMNFFEKFLLRSWKYYVKLHLKETYSRRTEIKKIMKKYFIEYRIYACRVRVMDY
jgi:hypothetical protein